MDDWVRKSVKKFALDARLTRHGVALTAGPVVLLTLAWLVPARRVPDPVPPPLKVSATRRPKGAFSERLHSFGHTHHAGVRVGVHVAISQVA